MTSTVLIYVAVAAGIAAVVKILTSSRGNVSIPGIKIQWSK